MFANFNQFFASFVNFCQVLAISVNFYQLQSTFGNFCQLLSANFSAAFAKFCILPNICQFLAAFKNIANFSHVILPSSICQFVNLLASQLVSFTACASWSSRACHNVECDNVTDSVSRSVTQSLNHCLSVLSNFN